MLEDVLNQIYSRLMKDIQFWHSIWKRHYPTVIKLITINVFLTFIFEFIGRSLWSLVLFKSQSYHFLVAGQGGSWAINQQSLINIWMSFFATAIGVPSFYLSSCRKRFKTFILVGIIVSLLGQTFAHFTSQQSFIISWKRLFFDLGYLCSVKYLTYEIFRSALICPKTTTFKMGRLRLLQKLLTNTIKILLLNLFGPSL